MAGRTKVESALLVRGAVVMTLLSIVDVDMLFNMCWRYQSERRIYEVMVIRMCSVLVVVF